MCPITGNAMLRIKTQKSAERVSLALAGDLTGVWVSEFSSVWRKAHCSLGGRVLSVDLSDVTRVDKAGEYLLALIRCSGSELTGSGLVIGDLLETIASNWPVAALNSDKEA
jgi:ABC-type transporter Mla MlaB component